MKKLAVMVAASVLGLAAGGAVLAQGGPGMGGEGGRGGGGRMQALLDADTNKDGALSKAELQALRETQFARMDVNKDGFLTEADREAARAQMGDRAKGDGKGPKGDGKGPKGDGKGPKGEGKDRPGGGYGPGGGGDPARFDTNKDGKVSKAEFLAAPMPMMDRIDTNKNGLIEKAELDVVKARMAERRGGGQGGAGGGGAPY